jgi:uncharacterized membrane protein YgdD (TMEM256/DUF423 family)
MSSDPTTEVTDESQLLFGAGFAFGVMCSLVLVAILMGTVTGSLTSTEVITTVGAIVFAGVIGSALYLLAFHENRAWLPIGTEQNEDVAPDSGD